jgi:hypothetical protein
VRDYVQACELAGQAPDMDLLGPLMPLLNAGGSDA